MSEIYDSDREIHNYTAGVVISEPKYQLILARDDIYVLEVELPGVDKCNIEIEVSNRSVNIKGWAFLKDMIVSKIQDKERGIEGILQSNESWKNIDRIAGNKQLRWKYHLLFMLPDLVDERQVDCKSYENGVLLLSLPMEKNSNRRKVPVL